jgi:hypothetical protein
MNLSQYAYTVTPIAHPLSATAHILQELPNYSRHIDPITLSSEHKFLHSAADDAERVAEALQGTEGLLDPRSLMKPS